MSEATPAKPHDPGTSGFWWIPGGLLASAAAAIVLWWVWPPNDEVREFASEVDRAAVGGTGDEHQPTQAQRAPLPNYVLETDGGLERARGDTGETSSGVEPDDAAPDRHHYRRDTPFEWVLRPIENTSVEPVGVRGFAFVDGSSAGLPLTLDPLAQAIESGAIRIKGEISQLGLEPGRYTIALAIGRPAALPAQAADVFAPSGAATPRAWVVRRVDVVIED
jgi:hypothetical protein